MAPVAVIPVIAVTVTFVATVVPEFVTPMERFAEPLGRDVSETVNGGGAGTLMVVENAGTLSAFSVMTKLNGVAALPEVAVKFRLKPDVAPGLNAVAPGMTNGITSNPGL